MSRTNLILATILTLAAATLCAQTSRPTLPANYKTIFENPDLLVMHVRYGAHEVIPMHDHPAYPTLYVYLSDSGEVDMLHDKGFVAHRPPTHTGSFRIAPRTIERHTVTSRSDTDSEFLRVELKQIPYSAVKQIVRQEAPKPPVPGTKAEYENSNIRIERIVCPASAPCTVPQATAPSLLIAIQPIQLQTHDSKQDLKQGTYCGCRPTSPPSP